MRTDLISTTAMDVALDKDTLNQPEDTSLSQEFQVPQFVLVLAGYSEHVSYVTSKDGKGVQELGRVCRWPMP
jgi:hypothetical protein